MVSYLTMEEYSKNDTFYTKPNQTKETFSIYASLNCPMRKPTGINTCFCSEPIKDSIWPQCQQYKGKSNTCMEAVCCNSCDINQQNKCPF